MVERRAETTFTSRWGGDWKAISFYNKATQTVQLVLQKGHIVPDEPTLVRMHQMSMLDDIYGATGARGNLLSHSMEIIGEEGAGIIVVLTARGSTSEFTTRFLDSHAGNAPSGMDSELRYYGEGATIPADLGLPDPHLLNN